MIGKDVQTERVIAERFALEELAGHGGMAKVYRARDLRTGERVAVKVQRADDRSIGVSTEPGQMAMRLSGVMCGGCG